MIVVVLLLGLIKFWLMVLLLFCFRRKVPRFDRLECLLTHHLCYVGSLLVPPRMMFSTAVTREGPLPIAPCLNKSHVGQTNLLVLVFRDICRRNKSVISLLAARTLLGYSCFPIKKLLSSCVLRGHYLSSSASRRNRHVRYSPCAMQDIDNTFVNCRCYFQGV